VLRRSLLRTGPEMLRATLLCEGSPVLRRGLLQERDRMRPVRGQTRLLPAWPGVGHWVRQGLLPAGKDRREGSLLPAQHPELRPVRPAVPREGVLRQRHLPPGLARPGWSGIGCRDASHDDVGNGPAVVLLHAGIADRTMWSEHLEPLAEARYRVLAVDLPGFGEARVKPGEQAPWADVDISDAMSRLAVQHHSQELVT
jgi:hypothetical protein